MADGTEVRVTIRVKPGSARAAVGGAQGEALVVRVCERAVDGRATEAALRAVAEALGARRRDVRLVTGATSREKVVAVDIEAAPGAVELLARLRAGPAGAPDE